MYQPNRKILERYADVMVNFALGKGTGIKKGDVVYVNAYENAKPFFVELLRAITKAGGHAISEYMPDNDRTGNVERDFYLSAEDHQLSFFPKKYYRGLVDEVDHYLFVIGEADVAFLKDVDPKKIIMRNQAMGTFRAWRRDKENRGKLTWTIVLYGTPAMAHEAGLSEKSYWDQIVNACFLNAPDPVAKWREVEKKIVSFKKRLTKLPIEKLRVTGPDADLSLALGRKRVWEGGGGANMPSFEIFTSPDWRGAEGWIRFNQPIYAQGNLMKNVKLRFSRGKVVRAGASQGKKILNELIKTPNGDKIGEFSLTDKRLSPITKFMATTLYDENIGGPHGNMHIALGNSFHACYAGDPTRVTKRDWARLGFNDSAVHRDFISTAPRTVTAHLANGKEKTIYRDGMFTI